jgi:ketol-acid reductoisomerase
LVNEVFEGNWIAKHPIEIIGKKLRAAMPFLDPVTVEEVARTR